MYPYDYTDLLQLHLNSDVFDYDVDARIAQYASAFGPDEKGHPDDHHIPNSIILSASDGFGSSDSSSPSRSPSVSEDVIKAESLEDEIIMAGPPSPSSTSTSLMKSQERTKSFDDTLVNTRLSPVPSVYSKTRRSRKPLTGRRPSADALSSKLRTADLSFTRKRVRRLTSPAHLSDEDADDESDSDTDDEYVPTPRSNGAKRRRVSSQLPLRRSAPPNRSTSTSPAPIKRPSAGSSLSRNRQATSITAIDKACSGSNLSFICPECGWKQANKRLPDFKRHLRTHTRPAETDQSKGWWCKGVPVEDAHKFDLPKDSRPFIFLGQERIGGCLQTFSRRDALKRHLDNTNVVCVGRPCEATED